MLVCGIRSAPSLAGESGFCVAKDERGFGFGLKLKAYSLQLVTRV